MVEMPESILIVLAIPAFLFFLLLEAGLSAALRRGYYERQDTFASLAMGIGNVAIGLGWKTVELGLHFWLYEHRFFDLGGGTLTTWAALFLAEDFCYYWFHRVSHESRFFWAAHVNHHSSQKYNLATALRQSWTTAFTGFIFWLPLPLLGFHPLMIVTQRAVSLLYQFWIHTEFIGKLGPIEWIFNTPSHHRVHHGSNPQYLDRNHGGILIVWDRLFGSFEPERERVRYGLTTNLSTFNPVVIAFHEWRAVWNDVRRDLPLGTRAAYAFRAPGWSHDGSRKTSHQMRAERDAGASPV